MSCFFTIFDLTMGRLPQKLSIIIATGFGSGYLPIAPGSWGSVVAAVLGWWLLHWSWGWYLAITGVIFFAGVYAVGAADEYFSQQTKKLHDNKRIVIDEWVGQLVALLPLFYFGRSIWTLVIGLFLFRAFDTAKFGLAKYWDRRSNRWGVILDDVFAGLHAAILLSFGLWIAGHYPWASDLFGLYR
jgi:phosphatidylglycerophosphatase A